MLPPLYRPRVAEFFAGIGLVRAALEEHGLQVAWANDIEPAKQQMYVGHFGPGDFVLGDIRDLHGENLPDVAIATASFPCTDLSLAGNRKGLKGEQSGMFWEYARILREMKHRRPFAVMLENVPSFASSHGGRDLYLAIRRLNRLGYWCDILIIDARRFVPQSRPRLFIVGARAPLDVHSEWVPSPLRPAWIGAFATQHPDLRLQALPLTLPIMTDRTLGDVVERLPLDDTRWWTAERHDSFLAQLSPVQAARLKVMQEQESISWATAYRRTRVGKPAWEIRADQISGCLRTARGGSSKQALVEASNGQVRVRWMTAIEYARLQGADDYILDNIPDNRALFGFGDAVCVPVVSWLAKSYLIPLLSGQLTRAARIYEGELVSVK
jgi:DNA (cytosine-5)-methyltransferase 1